MKAKFLLWVTVNVLYLASPCVAAPDRAQFLRECLESVQTPETSKFNDYTEGSYHIDKLDLLNGLEEATRSKPGPLRAVIILGPSGPLWSYQVIIALTTGDSVRLNRLVMPHARITNKSTLTQSTIEFEHFLAALTTSSLLAEGDPAVEKEKELLSRNFGYDVLIATWNEGHRSMRFAELEKFTKDAESNPDVETFLRHLNTVLKLMETTYPKQNEVKADRPAK